MDTACAPPLNADAVGFSLTDAGNGDRFHAQMGDQFRFVAGIDWLHFNGRVWDVRNARDKAFEAAKVVARSIVTERDDATHQRFSERSLSRQRLENMLECARTRLVANSEDFDAETHAFNVQNGVVRFERDTGGRYAARLDRHSQSDLMRAISRASYVPGAKARMWIRHLNRVLPDVEMRAYVQRILGYCLLGLTREQVFFIFHGKGGDGKTTTVSAVMHVMGDYATTMDVGKLLESKFIQNPEAPTPMLASLAGDKRLVSSSEPPPTPRWAKTSSRQRRAGTI